LLVHDQLAGTSYYISSRFFLDNSRDFINFWEDSQRSRKKTTTERRTKETIKERLLHATKRKGTETTQRKKW